ncbi:Protein FAR1-RELATED SEQUENCE [Arachis hypogaea]|nr:Protein FAR1-RELATED SEQUENCE [Arachis hypogaea]
MQLEKFIHNGYNLREFVEHFQHYLDFMRRRELVADYKFTYGEPVVKIKLEAIEQFPATVYTREVFELFLEVLMLASNVRVVSTKRTSACVLFEVAMYCKQRSWAVSWAEEDDEFSCFYQRMESFRLPCVHMAGVLVYLNMTAIPRSLILERWTKRAKQPRAHSNGVHVGEIPDAAYMSMHAAMLDDCRELVSLSCRFFEGFVDVKTRFAKERQSLRDKHRQRCWVLLRRSAGCLFGTPCRPGIKDAVEELSPPRVSSAVFRGVDYVERADIILASVKTQVWGKTSIVLRLARLTIAWKQERG